MKRTLAMALLLLTGTLAGESHYVAKATHLGARAVAISCLDGADPTVAGNVGGALIVSCGR